MITADKKKHVGQLFHRVDFEVDRGADDGMGGGFEDWQTDFEAWAQVKPVSGNQRLQLDAQQSTVTHTVTMRYRPDVSLEGRRMKHGDRVFKIRYYLNEGEEGYYTQLAASEEL